MDGRNGMISGAAGRTRLVIRLPRAVARGATPAIARSIRRSIDRCRPAEVECDACALRTVDLAAVDLLARVRLAAARAGAPMVITHAPGELRDLVELCGLSGVLEIAAGPPPVPG